MYCLVFILGGLLIMMGQHTRSESLFCYFRIEGQVPEDHLLHRIDGHVSSDFVQEKLRDCYSDTGRPSIHPEVLLRILLLGYLYGVTSERRLVEELRIAPGSALVHRLASTRAWAVDNTYCNGELRNGWWSEGSHLISVSKRVRRRRAMEN